MKKKFVFVLPSTHAGGGIRVIITLINLLKKENNEVVLYVYSDEGDTRYSINEDVEVIHYKEVGGGKFGRIFCLQKIIKKINTEHRNDIIIISDQITVALSGMIHTENIYRYIQADDYNAYNDLHILKSHTLLRIYKHMIRKVNRSQKLHPIFVSEYVREQYMNNYGHDNERRILNPPISSEFYKTWERKTDETNICIIGRIHENKGFQDFIEAWKMVSNKNLVNEVFVITPDDLSGFDTQDMTILHANNDHEMNMIYNKAHIFISTGRNEGFGLPALEAMSTGCACILCDNGGVREYAKNNINCLLYEAKNIKELSDDIDMLVRDKEKQNLFAIAGMETVKKFSEQSFVETFLRYVNKDIIE